MFEHPRAPAQANSTKTTRCLWNQWPYRPLGTCQVSWKPVVPAQADAEAPHNVMKWGASASQTPGPFPCTLAGLDELPGLSTALAAFPRMRLVSEVHREGPDPRQSSKHTASHDPSQLQKGSCQEYLSALI